MHGIPPFYSALLAFMFLACGIVFLAESEYRNRTFIKLFWKFWGLPPAKRLFFAVLLAMNIVWGSTKTNQEDFVITPPGQEQYFDGGGMFFAEGESAGLSLTTNQCLAGFALVRVATNAAAWLTVPSNAVVCPRWLLRGAAEDTFWLPATNWSFTLGSNSVGGTHVSSSGTLSFGRSKGSPRAAALPDGTDMNFLAPLQGSLGTAPQEGRFWYAPTASNSVIFTWEHVFAGRDPGSPVTFQAELFWNGDFVYRYAFTNAPALTNFVVGAQHNGGGETWALNDTNLLANGLELHWRAFGMLAPGVEDHDFDGLSTYGEVMLYGTNPALKDSDRDGLEDAAELEAGTDPLNPDTDRDGLADGIDPQPGIWNDPDATNACDGLTFLYKIQHGLDPAADNSADSDNDGWPDWKEVLAGTSPTDPSSTPQNEDGSCKLFDATVTLNADLPCPAVLNVGGHTLVLQKAGSWTLTLKEGVAYGLTLTAPRPCAASLSCSLSSAFAALQDPGGVFSGGADVPGGAPAACGMIAQPVVTVGPGRVCFHSGAPKTVYAEVAPPMRGVYGWLWNGGELSSATGRHANISWDGGSYGVCVSFTAAGASAARSACREVTRCSRFVEKPGWCDGHGCEHWFCACDDDDSEGVDLCHFHGRSVAMCRAESCPTHNCPYDECPEGWCHRHGCVFAVCSALWCHMCGHILSACVCGAGVEGVGGGGAGETGEPSFGSCGESLATVNNDDDNASGADDSGEAPVAGENDLVAVWPLGYYDGQCCPCPEHQVPPEGSESAELESCPARLALHADTPKTAAFGATVYAGQAVYVEGLSPSPSVGADRVVWKWTDEENHVHRVTNAFTVLSVRLFGDSDLDGDVDADDKALRPALTNAWGWAMPASANVFRPVRLRTDVGLSGGVYTLSLSGSDGTCQIWATGNPASTNSPLLACGQTVTNGINGVSFLSGSDTDLYVEAVSNGTATLTYAYAGTGEAAGISCAASLKMTAFTITLEPVTTENSPEVYNPCGIATNGTGYYKIAVEPSSLFPDDKISWGVVSGDVSFVENGDTGRLVAVKGGGVEGGFKLGVDIEGLSLPTNPCVAGRVLEPKVIPVTVWIVRDDNGDNAACTENRVQELLGGVNTIFKQCAMTFCVNGSIQYTNREEWLDIDFTNGWSGELESIRNVETATGGIELYFVNRFLVDDQQSDVLGIEDTQGIVLRSGISERTLAHEIGHACGLLDIYPYRSTSNTLEMVVSGPVTADRLPQDWGGDYYTPGLLQANLITYRLLMMGYEDPLIMTTYDMPLGSVYGTWFYRQPPLFEGDIAIDIWEQGLAPVGLDSMGNRQPFHQ